MEELEKLALEIYDEQVMLGYNNVSMEFCFKKAKKFLNLFNPSLGDLKESLREVNFKIEVYKNLRVITEKQKNDIDDLIKHKKDIIELINYLDNTISNELE